MKKMIKQIAFCAVIFCFAFSLTSCNDSICFDSLDEYASIVLRGNVGYSSIEIDHPDYFLPSQTFITDFRYVDGAFYIYEKGALNLYHDLPGISILALRYEADIYEEAKSFMLENIPAYDDTRYIYGNYTFYENANAITLHDGRSMPIWFTMACYNDIKRELVFIGFCGSDNMVAAYEDDMVGNWVSFIDTYYGEYYDFSE